MLRMPFSIGICREISVGGTTTCWSVSTPASSSASVRTQTSSTTADDVAGQALLSSTIAEISGVEMSAE